MFSKNKINEPAQKAPEAPKSMEPEKTNSAIPVAKPKPPASMLSQDLNIVGNIKTTGDIQVEGTVEGDIKAHLLTIGETATIKGEVVADDVVINGRIISLKVY